MPAVDEGGGVEALWGESLKIVSLLGALLPMIWGRPPPTKSDILGIYEALIYNYHYLMWPLLVGGGPTQPMIL